MITPNPQLHVFLLRARRVMLGATVGGALALAAGSSSAWNWGTSVTGSGQVVSVKREVSGFTEISVNLPAAVVVVQGSAEGVTIEADDNIVPLIETVVESGQLRIRTLKDGNYNFNTRSQIRITVNARTVEGLTVNGSGDVMMARLQTLKLKARISGSGNLNIKALQVDKLTVSIAGSGDCLLEGASNSLDANIAGSGNIRAGRLAAGEASIHIAGSGDATFWVRESLAISVAGSGNVKYYGDPKNTKSSIAGSGSVKRLGATPV